MVHAAWQLGERPELASFNLRRWAHTLGYRGHWLTKSRTWSTTFAQLRDGRHQHDPWGQPYDNNNPTIDDWHYTGIGYQAAGDTWLARSAANNRRINRRTA